MKEKLEDLSRGVGIPLSVVIAVFVFFASSLFAGQKYLDERIGARLEIFTQKFESIEKQQAELGSRYSSDAARAEAARMETAQDIAKRQQWIVDNIIEIQRSIGELRGMIKDR